MITSCNRVFTTLLSRCAECNTSRVCMLLRKKARPYTALILSHDSSHLIRFSRKWCAPISLLIYPVFTLTLPHPTYSDTDNHQYITSSIAAYFSKLHQSSRRQAQACFCRAPPPRARGARQKQHLPQTAKSFLPHLDSIIVHAAPLCSEVERCLILAHTCMLSAMPSGSLPPCTKKSLKYKMSACCCRA